MFSCWMENIYTLEYCTCAKCGRKMSTNTPGGVVFNNTTNPFTFIYKPCDGNGVDYDPHELPTEDTKGATFVPTIGDLDEDDEGFYWKSYCKLCWNELKNNDNEYIYNNTGISEFE